MRHSHAKTASPLREAGLKSTPGRRAVLDILAKSTSPLSPEQIHAKVGSGVCDRATVYRILESLGEAGLVQRVILNGKTLYLPEESSHHHHHIVCRKCRSTVCLDECLISPLEKKASQLGFRDIRHSLQLTGLCAKCSN
jgi:Fe2+ or Zn2+ uptake regulation protein